MKLRRTKMRQYFGPPCILYCVVACTQISEWPVTSTRPTTIVSAVVNVWCQSAGWRQSPSLTSFSPPSPTSGTPMHTLVMVRIDSNWFVRPNRTSYVQSPDPGWVVRASVSDWRTFPDMYLIYGWRMITSWVRRPLWVNQPGQLSLPSLRGR